MQALRRFLWLLATRTGRLDQPPFNDARGLGALDRVLRPGERTADGFLDQLASAVIGGGDGLHLHDPFGEFSRRHRPRRVTQHVVDQAKAFAGAKPAAACRRSVDRPRWRCKACRHDFSITSGTLFAWHKLPLRTYLLAVAAFCNEVKGKSMLALARDLDVQYKTAFVLAHKLREAIASSTKGLRIGGEGRTAEIDGACFGGHVRPENLACDRIDRRLAENQSGKRQVVVVMREREGRTLTQVFSAEEAAAAAIGQRIAKGTLVHADESPAWNPLHARFAMRRVNHQDGYSVAGACTNGAESYFSRLRRGELGHHHHLAGPYLPRYAQEAAWREDLRRVSNGEQAYGVVRLALRCRPSVDFSGYWQRARAA